MSTFTLSLKLNTSASDEAVLMERFYQGFLMYNRLVSHARKRLRGLRQDKRYRAAMDNTYRKGERKKEELSALRMEYGLSEYQFHSWISIQQKRRKRYIDSLTAQKIASTVWKSVEDVLFRKGKTIHFKKLMVYTSMEGKNNAAGLRFRDKKLHWLGLCIQVRLHKKDWYVQEALQHKVKYCRIVRKPVGIRWHFYLQVVLEGIPPQKHRFLENGDVGIDPGVSTEAAVSGNGCILTELAPERPEIRKEIRRLQRRMNRSLRAANPENYHEDGTPKKHKKWKKTRHYKQDQMRLKTLRRRNADTVKQSEEALADRILCVHGTDIHTEKMDYRALAARAKENRVTGKGKHRSKKRFGSSIAGHAPARFLCILNRKLSYIGKELHLVDTRKYRASQFDHVTGGYTKVSLSTRWKEVGGHPVQRDLYSAFLLMNAAGDEHPDIARCNDTFETFLKFHDTCICELKEAGISRPATFGL